MSRYLYFIPYLLVVSGCDDDPKGAAIKTPHVDTTATLDTSRYEASWNMGENREEPEKSVDTRFAIRVTRSRSLEVLTVFLDSASVSSYPGGREFFPADSINVTGLRPIDSFTLGCNYGSGPWEPRIGILPDTVYERAGRPRFIWVLDTVNARIRQLPTDSASCIIATPD